MPKNNLTKWFITAGVSLVLAGSYLTLKTFLAGPRPALPPDNAFPVATRIADEHPLPSFRLTRDHGEFTEANLSGKWTFLFFGYTQCPDVCPLTLSAMKRVMQRLSEQNLALPQVVFVSVDPRRDTPQLLGEFVPAFDARFIGVTGSDENLEPLAQALGVKFMRHDGLDKNTYTVDHTAHLYLIAPDRRLKSSFPFPHQEEFIVREYKQAIQ